MFRADDGPLGVAGPNELPPYYSKRLQVVLPSAHDSIRAERRLGDSDAQAERLFRDFKMGLLTLVVVALLLLAYFWEGEGTSTQPNREDEDVLSFSLSGRRRAEVVPPRPVAEAADITAAAPAATFEPSAPAAGARDGSRGATPAAAPPRREQTYVVRPGDTLSGIALRFYGNAALWKIILEANQPRLRRPADLRPGMRLVVPVRDAQAESRSPASPYLARAGPTPRR